MRYFSFLRVITPLCLVIPFNNWADNALPVMLNTPGQSITETKITKQQSQQRLNDAKSLLARGKKDAAIYMLQQLAKDDPNNYQVLLELGRIAVESKNWAYAIAVFQQASKLRPKEIYVRLVLMGIYKAYQMPIQEVMVSKEVLALEADHIVANQRLAELYKELAMLEEEIATRQHLKILLPDDYRNLKRLASILDEAGQLWEASIIYEQNEYSTG